METEALAQALRSLAESLRFYQAMGLKDLPLTRDYFHTAEQELRAEMPAPLLVSELSSPRCSQPNALAPCPVLASVDICPMH